MKILLIDTTTDNLIAAVVDGDAVTDGSVAGATGKTSEILCQAVQNVLDRAKLTFADLDAYACAVGPGSFTGIRIGIATVKGYCAACEKPLLPYNSLEMLCGGNGGAKIDAGNGWYYAEYRDGKEVVPPQLLSYDDARAKDAATYTDKEAHLRRAVATATNKFRQGAFAALSPLYIRKSQAEEKG